MIDPPRLITLLRYQSPSVWQHPSRCFLNPNLYFSNTMLKKIQYSHGTMWKSRKINVEREREREREIVWFRITTCLHQQQQKKTLITTYLWLKISRPSSLELKETLFLLLRHQIELDLGLDKKLSIDIFNMYKIF